MRGHFHDVPKIVRPRDSPKASHHPLIIAHLDSRAILIERTGETVPITDAAGLVSTEPPSIWICPNASWLVQNLDRELDHNPMWQFRCSPVKREIITRQNLSSGRKLTTQETMVHFFGFRNPGKKRGYWHHPIDPTCFIAESIAELLADPLPGLLQWGRDLREWCATNQLTPSPTAGGLAAQLLRDRRFYPVARRKVPARTNTRARQVLPGNHYDVRAQLWKSSTGTVLDMSNAHHNCAAEISFPDADGLLARGHFKVADPTVTTVPSGPPWRKNTDPSFTETLTGHGLLQLRLTIPRIHPDKFPPPWAATSGQRLAWVFTNELPMIRELGIIIDGIEAAWLSYDRDTGLNKYATWALTELATMSARRRVWMKPTLLAAYGILAARPRIQEYGYKRAEHGQVRVYPAGHGTLTVRAHIGETEREMPTTNVIQRGMIEAETRMRCLGLARDLTRRKVNVLCIYADAVIVEAGPQLPLLPPPWRVKGELTNLRFVNTNAYASDQESKLPGVPRDDKTRLEILDRMRNGR